MENPFYEVCFQNGDFDDRVVEAVDMAVFLAGILTVKCQANFEYPWESNNFILMLAKHWDKIF